MAPFFTILFILVVLNIALLVSSAVGARQKASQVTKRFSDASKVNIYPFDLLTSKYKKAI